MPWSSRGNMQAMLEEAADGEACSPDVHCP